MNESAEIMKIGRKCKADTPGYSQEVYHAVVSEMKSRKVNFLPAAVIRKVVKNAAQSKAQVEYAVKYYQGSLGLANHL